MTFETDVRKPSFTDAASGIPQQREFDMTSLAKGAGLAGILVAVVATVTPELKADQFAVREGPRRNDRTGRERFGHHLLGRPIRWLARSDHRRHPDRAEWRRRKACLGAFLVSAFAWPVSADLGSLCHRRAAGGSSHSSARRPDRRCAGSRLRGTR